MALSFLIAYKIEDRWIMRIINIRSKKGVSTSSAMLVGRPPAVPAVSPAAPAVSPAAPAVSPAAPAVSPAARAVSSSIPKAKLSTRISRESLAKEDKQIKSLEKSCRMNIRNGYLDSSNDDAFNMFIIFISRMHKLMELLPSSLESITQKLCNDRININDSLKHLKDLSKSWISLPLLYTRNYEDVFKLLKLTEPVRAEGPLSDRVYALDELGFNLVLLAAANAIRFPDNKTYDFIYNQLSTILFLSKYPLLGIQTYYLRSFFKYLEKFRISEALVPSENNFYFVEAIQYFSDKGEIKFKDKGDKVESLSQIIALPEKEKPMYVIITFHPEYPEGGARRIDSFELQGYKINSIILESAYSFPTLLSITDDKTLCIITKDSNQTRKLLLYKKQGTLLETIEEIDRRDGIPLLSLHIIAILYELESGVSGLSSEVRSIPHIDIGNVNAMLKEKKREFRDSVMKKFLAKYDSFEPQDTFIFRILEFIRLSTGNVDTESYDGVIAKYLFGKGDARDTEISVAPFIEKVVKDFLQTRFYLTSSDEKNNKEVWKSIMQEIELYKEEPTEIKLDNAIDAMTLFTITLHNVFPFDELQKKVHCDYILATIYLIKRLWKVYDRCITVMKLLPEKNKSDDKEKLLHYLLLKFNKLIYIKCYFASFSSNRERNQELEDKRLKLEEDLKAYKLKSI
jgi:hypothetical protein